MNFWEVVKDVSIVGGRFREVPVDNVAANGGTQGCRTTFVRENRGTQAIMGLYTHLQPPADNPNTL